MNYKRKSHLWHFVLIVKQIFGAFRCGILSMETAPVRSKKLGHIELGLCKSTNIKTMNR